ncbi:MAG: hypothetical protein BGO47_05135 [Microbacterium sp. 67-17]|jgi:hypothetical protein|uniref:hypothetical protein n=1 Tax=unclassified Microbacterium TaxID=2609290 RepID=UPI0009642AC8|nr:MULTISPECIES: hypothetical protein [unclassified Microbacterium]OJV93339.1 MAG: hypothetical protein BGO47_05135 [Microbacterium sp. 67-17]
MNTIETFRAGRADSTAAAEAPPRDAVETGVDRVCALLGIPAAAPAATDDAAITAVVFQDAEEYLREVFGERTAREGAQTVQARPIVHLHVAPPTTPPRAA